jgi:plastocyanin
MTWRGVRGRRARRVVPTLALLAAGVSACGGAAGDAAATSSEGEPAPIDGVYGSAPAAVRGVPSVVTLTPVRDAAGAAAGAGGPATPISADGVIDQFGLQFSPSRLLVVAGSTVTFTNSESALTHNVHVRSVAGDSTLFDGDAVTGEAIRLVLPDEGAYDILCEMHPGMSAVVYATSAPWAAFAGGDGAFSISSVPPGDYSVGLWTADAGLRAVRTVTVGQGATEVRLLESG